MRRTYKIVLCGPPKSGKSVFREGLKKAIINMQSGIYPYIITACPDGEGAWFQETVAKNKELARRLKDVYKCKFTPEFVKRIEDSVRLVKLPLVFIDVGGIPSKENQIIMRHATHSIIIASLELVEQIVIWRKFVTDLGLKVIAEIMSDYTGKKDIIPVIGSDGIYRGSVHYLERGEVVSNRPTVQFMAKVILSFFNN